MDRVLPAGKQCSKGPGLHPAAALLPGVPFDMLTLCPKEVPMEARVALVTGGSRGIGAAIVRSLAKSGWVVAVNCLKNDDLARKVLDGAGGRGGVYPADAREPAAVAAMVRRVEAELGPVAAAVHNANVAFPMGPFWLQPWEEVRAKLVGELGAFHGLCAAVLPGMAERRWGRVVAVSSSLSRFGHEGFGAHAAAKAALDGAVRVLAREAGPFGVTVNTVAPGLVDTDATAHMPPEQKRAAAAFTPLRRVGLPEDIGGVVAFLCSEEARWITGQYLPVNGGTEMV
jgi:3-oxoacyl-[acyl-carrier protein] reductase